MDAFVFFGQFIDHDLALSPIGVITKEEQPLFSFSKGLFHEQIPIEVPEDDPVFSGTHARKALEFERAVSARMNNEYVHPRQIMNSLTSFLDLGQVCQYLLTSTIPLFYTASEALAVNCNMIYRFMDQTICVKEFSESFPKAFSVQVEGIFSLLMEMS